MQAVAGFGQVWTGSGFVEVLLVGFGFGVLGLGQRECMSQIWLWFLIARFLGDRH